MDRWDPDHYERENREFGDTLVYLPKIRSVFFFTGSPVPLLLEKHGSLSDRNGSYPV